MHKHFGVRALLLLAAATLVLALAGPASADVKTLDTRYIVVLAGTGQASDATLGAIQAAGGVVVHDMSRQTGVLIVESSNAMFADTVRSSAGVVEVGNDFAWKNPGIQDVEGILDHPDEGLEGGGPEPSADPLEPLQWDMAQIRTEQAHAIQAGSRLVEVGILDTGIDGDHVDFTDADGSNVNCAKGRDFIPLGPGLTVGTPCDDNNFHGTHVAGTVGARANGVGIVGVAPNVELIPVKVCDVIGYCYASSTAAGITYAGAAKFEVMNMSFYVDDDTFLASTEFKCMNDPEQRAFRLANERAMMYAIQQGVVPVAALGNSDNDLAHPPEPYENNCEVVPAETQGVIGTMSIGPNSEKSFFSNYGVGATDVAAPGGNFSRADAGATVPTHAILSTVPGGWGYAQGTSMASPHAAGVAALIVSQYGRIGTDAGEPDVVMRPTQVEEYLEHTTIDIGEPAYDECFGNGRVDAFRAVRHEVRHVYEPNPPCPEYAEGPNEGNAG